MNRISVKGTAIVMWLAVLAVPAFAGQDMTGSRDHPEIPRIEGAVIRGFAYSDYDEGEFIEKVENGRWQTTKVGGKRTRLLYLVPSSISRPGVFRNYETALEELGESRAIFSCDGNCPSAMGKAFTWSQNRRIPTNMSSSDYMYVTDGLYYRDQAYRYFVVTNESSRYHVSVYSAFLTGLQTNAVKGKRAVHLDILEEADFEPTLEIVTSSEITEGLTSDGRIALYGIYFDLDKAALKEESKPTLEAIAEALAADPSLTIYVVGHTDGQGSYEYNLDLSRRRAASVVEDLSQEHGIERARLVAVGVGPVAPMASNREEEGRALNRRVELVER